MQQPDSTLRAERELHADAVSAAVGLWIAVLAAIPMVALAAREDAWRFGSALVFALSLVGLHLAVTFGWFAMTWIWIKIALALVLSGLLGVQSAALRRQAQGSAKRAPLPEGECTAMSAAPRSRSGWNGCA